MHTRIKKALLRAAMSLDEAMSLLGLTPATMRDPAEVKKAFRAASLKHHPDLGGNTETMKLINQAHDLIEKLASQSGPGPYVSPEDRWKARAQEAEKAEVWVTKTLKESFSPEKFNDYFSKVMKKPFTFTDKLSGATGSYSSYVNWKTEWRSEDGETVFALSFHVNLDSVVRTKSLGGGDSGEFLGFSLSTMPSILHGGRKVKFKQREWASHETKEVLSDPNVLFPKTKILKMMSVGEKRKFQKRDMLLGLQRLVNADLGTIEKSDYAEVPFGPEKAWRVTLMRHSIMKLAIWNVIGLKGPLDKATHRRPNWDTKYISVYESEALLRAIVKMVHEGSEVKEGPDVGPALVNIINRAFEGAKDEAHAEAEKADA